mgnify:CR=1 FL=1
MHNFIMIQIDNQADDKVKINLTNEEMQKKYNGQIDDDEPLH